jgi:hypothetical protein
MKATKVGPGLYEVRTAAGTLALHIDVAELLREFGYADTEANRNTLAAEAEKALRRTYPDTRITIV